MSAISMGFLTTSEIDGNFCIYIYTARRYLYGTLSQIAPNYSLHMEYNDKPIDIFIDFS